MLNNQLHWRGKTFFHFLWWYLSQLILVIENSFTERLLKLSLSWVVNCFRISLKITRLRSQLEKLSQDEKVKNFFLLPPWCNINFVTTMKSLIRKQDWNYLIFHGKFRNSYMFRKKIHERSRPKIPRLSEVSWY